MQTAAALPGIIRDAREGGYEFGSLSELLNGADMQKLGAQTHRGPE